MHTNPQLFESANNLEPCGRTNPDILESDDVAKSGLVPRGHTHIFTCFTEGGWGGRGGRGIFWGLKFWPKGILGGL